ncbi:hypothetical protein AVEN_219976-1 [Araneus ventricosus]|uniref:Uncharacterized protein n=1 Tax=Araneus ventricosus TaxID=182803 RepID=A0A4Y2X4Z4_ARAVE|nr:hypothetical protein AVEN_219976-1 [Araneus ventricosus]
MMGSTPELALLLQASAPHQRESVWPLRMLQGATGPIHGGFWVEPVFEPGTSQPRSRDLTTTPPWLCSTVSRIETVDQSGSKLNTDLQF